MTKEAMAAFEANDREAHLLKCGDQVRADLMKSGQLQLAVYTATGAHSFADEKTIRRTAVLYRVPCITTIAGARAAAQAIVSRSRDPLRVWSLQEIHSGEGKEAAV